MKNILLSVRNFLKAWGETSKNWAEVIAFVVAAVWAVHTYRESVQPDRELRINTSSTLELSPFREGLCKADFTVNVDNVGKEPLQVAYVVLEAFKLDTKKITEGYLDDQEFQRLAESLGKKRVNSGVGSGYYRFNVKNGGGYTWFIPEQPNTDVGFTATIYRRGSEDAVGYEMQWTALKCSAAENEKDTPAKATR